MKKNVFVFIVLALAAACVKEAGQDVIDNNAEQAGSVGTPITISATLPEEGLTKVAFNPTTEGGKPTKMALTWQSSDKLRIFNHEDRNKFDDFTLESGAGTPNATFTGTPTQIVGATSFDVEIVGEVDDYSSQVQAEDGSTSHLKYIAGKKNIADYTGTIVFDEFSSILAITAKMPENVAESIKSVDLTASNDIFNGGKTLTITLTNEGDKDSDNILHFYATLPQGTQTIDAGTTIIARFNAPGTLHTVYTRYIENLGGSFDADKLNTININATESGTHAGLTSCDGTTAEKAYLIGDKYQMLAVAAELEPGDTRYFKMIDNVDMGGATWTPLNPSPFTKAVNFDGNGKKISNLNASLFNDLNGTIVNLTIENAVVNGGSNPAGILANTIKTAASMVDNVDINNSSVTATAYVGALICNITAANSSITNVDITNTNVTGTLAGGIIGFPQVVTSISSCNFVGNGTDTEPATKGVITANNQYAGGIIAATTANMAVTISDCTVMAAKIVSSYNKVGGAIGHLRSASSIEGSTVGSVMKPVFIEIPSIGTIVGGFIGLCEGGTVENCKAITEISATTNYIGGFIGNLNGGSVTGCKSYGTVTGLGYIGGFAGQISAATALSGNESYCNVTATGTYIGGFVGRLVGSVSCSNCKYLNSRVWTNIGNSNESFVGGFAGYIGSKSEAFTGTISNCLVSNATIDSIEYKEDGTTPKSSGSWVGGFAGGIGHATPGNNTGTIQLCRVHNSKPSGGNYTGGFAGVSYAAISKCCSTGGANGQVKGYGASIGGLVGYQYGKSIEYSYSTVNVVTSNKSNVGGLVGQAKTTTATECYSTGTVSGNAATTGGVFGLLTTSSSAVRCIRWNHSNTNKITGLKVDSTEDANCAVKTSGDSNFKTFVTDKDWDTGSTIWNYGNPPSLVGMPS